MKLPNFNYVRPNNVKEAITLLERANGEGKLIAGGQSLIPLLAFRMAAPDLLVDVSRLEELHGIRVSKAWIDIGATTRWCDIERDARLKTAHPLLFEAISHVAHYQIRSRGTVGGSIVHADPSAEFPAIAISCDAKITIQGSRGRREVATSDFIEGALVTDIHDDEIVTAIRFPSWNKNRRWGFEEYSRRRGDFAMAGVALYFDLDENGLVEKPHICAFGVGDKAARITVAESYLDQKKPSAELIRGTSKLVSESVAPDDDLHASGEYRSALVGTLCKRAMMRASGIML